MKIEIRDDKGALVRKLSSRKVEPETPSDDPDAAEDEAGKKALPKKAGLQRAVWDLRYEGATKIKAAKIDSGDPGEGPMALPGTYSARLTVDGRVAHDPDRGAAGPSRQRVPGRPRGAAGLRAGAARRPDAALRDRPRRALGAGAGERPPAALQAPAAAPLSEAASALVARCDALEDRLHNPKAEVVYDILAMPGGAKLYSRLAPLYSAASDGDGRPTQGMRDVYAVLKAELDALEAEWQALLATDLPALNAKARQLAPDFVVAPADR